MILVVRRKWKARPADAHVLTKPFIVPVKESGTKEKPTPWTHHAARREAMARRWDGASSSN